MSIEKLTDNQKGTGAHQLGEKSLIQGRRAEEFIGEVLTPEKKFHSKFSPSKIKLLLSCPGSLSVKTLPEKTAKEPGVKITPEIAESVQVYLDLIDELAPYENRVSGEAILYVEARVELGWVLPGMQGSCDCMIYYPGTRKLCIVDYKHGTGVSVSAEWNTQMMCYALGAIHFICTSHAIGIKPEDAIVSVELIISQPNALYEDDRLSRWETNVPTLLFWRETVLSPGLLAAQDPEAKLIPGGHCTECFCPGIGFCPELLSRAKALSAATSVEDAEKATEEGRAYIAEKVVQDEVLLDNLLSFSEAFVKWAKEIKAIAEQRAVQGYLRLPSRKVVRKQSNRVWVNEEDAGYELQNIIGENAFVITHKVVSPKKAEDLIKKLPHRDLIDISHLYEKPDKGLTIASLSDRRKEVLPETIQNDFMEIQ